MVSHKRKASTDTANSPSLGETNSGANSGVTAVLKKGPWTAEEDKILLNYVNKHGEGNWNAVQRFSGLSRCGKSCRLRWANHLRPDLKKCSISQDEETVIIRLHSALGNKWARMASELPGRTDNEIKNYWNTRLKRRVRAGLAVYPEDICAQVRNENQQSGTTSRIGGNQQLNLWKNPTLEIPDDEFERLQLQYKFIPCPSKFVDKSKSNNTAVHLHGYSFVTPQPNPSGYVDMASSLLQPGGSSDGYFGNFDAGFRTGHPFELPYPYELGQYNATCSEPVFINTGNMELPSFQTQIQDGGENAYPLDPIDVLLQSPQRCDSPRSSGLLESVLYESYAKIPNNVMKVPVIVDPTPTTCRGVIRNPVPVGFRVRSREHFSEPSDLTVEDMLDVSVYIENDVEMLAPVMEQGGTSKNISDDMLMPPPPPPPPPSAMGQDVYRPDALLGWNTMGNEYSNDRAVLQSLMGGDFLG